MSPRNANAALTLTGRLQRKDGEEAADVRGRSSRALPQWSELGGQLASRTVFVQDSIRPPGIALDPLVDMECGIERTRRTAGQSHWAKVPPNEGADRTKHLRLDPHEVGEIERPCKAAGRRAREAEDGESAKPDGDRDSEEQPDEMTETEQRPCRHIARIERE